MPLLIAVGGATGIGPLLGGMEAVGVGLLLAASGGLAVAHASAAPGTTPWPVAGHAIAAAADDM